MARQISAKYAGKCAHCNSAISPGDPIMYEPECKAVWHIECHQDRMSTEQSPVKPVQAGTTARFVKPSPAVQKLAAEISDTLDEREELIACLKRIYFRIDDAMELRANWNPREAHSDIVKTLNAVLGEGSWR